MGASERHDIFVRAHTTGPRNENWWNKAPTKWPNYALVFDTETTIDTVQRLTIGCFRRCKLGARGYQCIEEGLFHRDDLDAKQLAMLRNYVKNPVNTPGSNQFPPQMKLTLLKRSEFVTNKFWRAVRSGDLIVGFNLPFDIARLAVKSGSADDGGWSLALSMGKNPKTAEVGPDPTVPRIVVTSQNSKMAFMKLGSILDREKWPNESRLLDLRTLGWSLRKMAFSLKRACKAYKVVRKLKHKPSGRITFKEIKYCRRDVEATAALLNAMKAEFDQHPIKLNPDKAYSPASIAKAYLEKMKIAHPKKHFKIPNKTLGIAMQSYYGGRAECRIRKTPVPIIYTDFTSQYPTVNALLGNWDLLKASKIRFEVCTTEVKRMLSSIQLDETFDRKFWRTISFFVLMKPTEDILPVRTLYRDKTPNIGLNYLNSAKPIWYAGPDAIASALLTGKAPKIVKAIRMVHDGKHAGLERTNLGGMVEIDPAKDDFFQRVIEQRAVHKTTNKPLAEFLKVLGNSGSYGLFVEVNTETKSKPKDVKFWSGEKSDRVPSFYIEKPGTWYFPPLASLITAGGRLLLAMLEKCVDDLGGSYLFCDTDSMGIVASENGGHVHCICDASRNSIKVLDLATVESIAAQFKKLNPYDPLKVREILKIEDINHIDSDIQKPLRQLWGYAISSKRYALYTQTKIDVSIIKASGHGLGYLFAPKETKDDNEDEVDENEDDEKYEDETPEWIVETWDWLLRKELGKHPKEPTWLSLPAMMRMAMTSPNVMRNNRPEWLAPFNFFLFPLLSDLDGYPVGCDKTNFKFITPAESKRAKWKRLKGINLRDEKSYRITMRPTGKQDTVVPESFRIILRQYLQRLEVKSLAPDGSPCTADTKGLLRRALIVAGNIRPVGKETDRRWEQGEDPSMVDSKLLIYERTVKMVVADASDRKRWNEMGIRPLRRKTGLHQKTIYKIINGEPIRKQKLEEFKNAVGD